MNITIFLQTIDPVEQSSSPNTLHADDLDHAVLDLRPLSSNVQLPELNWPTFNVNTKKTIETNLAGDTALWKGKTQMNEWRKARQGRRQPGDFN